MPLSEPAFHKIDPGIFVLQPILFNFGWENTDYIDVGVFTGKKDEEKPLYMKKEKIAQERQTFTIVVDQQPTRVRIDPYNQLIDRIADDNMIDVTKQ